MSLDLSECLQLTVLWIFSSAEIHHRSLSLVTDSLLFSDCPVISWHSGSGRRDLGSPSATKQWNEQIMTTSVLCAAALTLHHRYQIVCVVKCVSKIPQVDESESCRLWRGFQKLTPSRFDSNLEWVNECLFIMYEYICSQALFAFNLKSLSEEIKAQCMWCLPNNNKSRTKNLNVRAAPAQFHRKNKN